MSLSFMCEFWNQLHGKFILPQRKEWILETDACPSGKGAWFYAPGQRQAAPIGSGRGWGSVVPDEPFCVIYVFACLYVLIRKEL